MKCLVATLLFALTLPARAHIGSPNVFFDGIAGNYPVHVVIRPANVVPGLAEISVRVEGGGVRRVSALPVFADAGRKGAPPPDVARLVPGETNLYAATLWLMKSGAYSVDVNVEGARGAGAVIVPVNAVATNTRGMSRPYALMLLVLAVFLFAGAVRIVGAIFSESLLPPGAIAGPAKILRGRVAMFITAAFLVFAMWQGKRWWDYSEREYRNKTLYRPAGLSARVLDRTSQNLLALEIDESGGKSQTPRLIPDHGKLMHLFLIREPDLKVFAHLHPVKRDWEHFEVALPPLPRGHYLIYADITHETGFAETLTAAADLPAPSSKIMQFWGNDGSPDQICGSGLIRAAPPENLPLPPDPDDSWHMDHETTVAQSNNVSRVSDGRNIIWLPPGDLIENRELSLRFQLLDTNGQPELLQPYIGMYGHAAVRRNDGGVFAHIHPSGTFSMAAQEYFTGATNETHASADASNLIREVSFPFAFPSPGAYHLWVQLKSGGRAYTGVFEAMVKAPK